MCRLTVPTNDIDARIFERSDTAMDLLYLIALAEEKKSDVLMPDREEQAVEIFEQYVSWRSSADSRLATCAPRATSMVIRRCWLVSRRMGF